MQPLVLPERVRRGIERTHELWRQTGNALLPVPIVEIVQAKGWDVQCCDLASPRLDAVAHIAQRTRTRCMVLNEVAPLERQRFAAAYLSGLLCSGVEGIVEVTIHEPEFVGHYGHVHALRSAVEQLMPQEVVDQCSSLIELATVCGVDPNLAGFRLRWLNITRRAQYVFNADEWRVLHFAPRCPSASFD